MWVENGNGLDWKEGEGDIELEMSFLLSLIKKFIISGVTKHWNMVVQNWDFEIG